MNFETPIHYEYYDIVRIQYYQRYNFLLFTKKISKNITKNCKLGQKNVIVSPKSAMKKIATYSPGSKEEAPIEVSNCSLLGDLSLLQIRSGQATMEFFCLNLQFFSR